jgi:hypothetical protein
MFGSRTTTLRMTTSKSYDYLNRLTAITSAAGGSNVVVFTLDLLSAALTAFAARE